MKIDFLGIGVQKAGTSTLHDVLRNHTQIYLPDIKEAHFFDFSENYGKGIDWFTKSYFSTYNNEQVVGEFTPEYIYVEDAPKRIFETLGPDVKFIVVFRNPVDRAISHYNMTYRRGLEKLNFFEAIKVENGKIGEDEWARMHYSYMSRGYYADQLKRFLELYPMENFLFLVFETDIVKQMETTSARIQSFLNLANESLNTGIKSNEAFTPKSVAVNRALRHPVSKRIGRTLMPLRIRKLVKETIFKYNKSGKADPGFTLSKETKEKLFKEYFYDDVKTLEALTGLSFNNIWYVENN